MDAIVEEHQKTDYITLIRNTHLSKRLGQNFLINIDMAKIEARYAKARNVIEIGTGFGILTNQLCKVAANVISVELDKRIYTTVSSLISYPNLKLINDDFFKLDSQIFNRCDMLVANIPYVLSSKVIAWISANNIEAVVCIQKEFGEHMMAKPSTSKYSKLSVISELSFDIKRIKLVSAECFYPKPKVSSMIVHLLPKATRITGQENKIISLLMEHKKKKVRNCIIDSRGQLGISKSAAILLSENIKNKNERPVHMKPKDILCTSVEILDVLSSKKSN